MTEENKQIAKQASGVAPQCGDFIQRGQFVVCQKCANNHTIPDCELTNEGKLVKRR